jgi:hypothetical protein
MTGLSFQNFSIDKQGQAFGRANDCFSGGEQTKRRAKTGSAQARLGDTSLAQSEGGGGHWILRWAAEETGHFKTAASAQAYFDQITKDIWAAEADGRLNKRLTLGGFLDPAFGVWAPLLPQSFRLVSSAAWAPAPVEAFREAPQTADLYTKVTNRKLPKISPTRERLRQLLASWYVPAWLTLLLAALAASMLQSSGWTDLHRITVAIVAGLILSRIGLFALIDASAWQGNQARYLFPVGTLVMIFPLLALPGRTAGARQRINMWTGPSVFQFREANLLETRAYSFQGESRF